MSFPNLPNITASITITRDDALNLILSSIAFEELGLSHIINAEGEKIQFALGLIPGLTQAASINDLLKINNSVRKTLEAVINKEIILQTKLQSVLDVILEQESDDFK